MTDEDFLRIAIAQADEARATGDAPFGSILVDADGSVVAEAHNTVITDRDIIAHPELKLALWAARSLTADIAATTTMYTSCQPCQMCSGAIARSGLGRVVFALSNEQLDVIKPGGGWPVVPQRGPLLYDEARAVFDGYYT
jgi:tRNA(Arg) A34 adenosine deaminase TadA